MSIRDKYAASILAEWDFRKGSLNDQSGSGNTLTATNANFVNSDVGRAFNFNGVDAQLNASGDVILGAEFTVLVLARYRSVSLTDSVLLANKDVALAQFDVNDADSMRFYSASLTPANIETPFVVADYTNKWTTYGLTHGGTDTKFFINGTKLGATITQTGTNAVGFGKVGDIIAGTKPWDGDIAYIALIGAALTDQEMAQFAEEIRATRPYTAVDFKSEARYINAIADGMMKKTGTDDWIVDGVGGVLSKVSDPERGQVLAVYSGAGNITYAYQYNIEVGYYRLRGWLKGDSANGGIARIKVGGTWMTGSNATDTWQMIDEVIYNPSNSSTPFKMGQTTATTSYAYYSDIECIKLNSNNENDFASPKAYIADGNGWNESVANVTAGFLENTSFEIGSGTWQVDDVDGFNKQISCIGAGTAAIPMGQNYGTWEFDLYKGGDGNETIVTFMGTVNAVWNDAAQTGYRFRFNSTERVALSRLNTGTDTFLGYTASSYVAIDTWYSIRVTRATNGAFNFYIKGGAFADWTLADVSGGAGSNPVTDNTITTSNYFVLNFGALDAIKNIKILPYIE